MAIKWKKEVQGVAAGAFLGILGAAATSIPVVGWGVGVGSYLYFRNKGPFKKKGEHQAKAA